MNELTSNTASNTPNLSGLFPSGGWGLFGGFIAILLGLALFDPPLVGVVGGGAILLLLIVNNPF